VKRTDRKLSTSMAVNTRISYQIQTRLTGGGSAWKTVTTVLWTRKNKGVTTACIGELIGHQEQKATSAVEWMDQYAQPMERRRSASYDGTRFWHRGAGLDSHEDILKQAWRGELPASFDGWWTPVASTPPGGYIHHPRATDPLVALCASSPLMRISDGPTNPDGTDRMCPTCETRKAELAGKPAYA